MCTVGPIYYCGSPVIVQGGGEREQEKAETINGIGKKETQCL